jgi:plastocyanin
VVSIVALVAATAAWADPSSRQVQMLDNCDGPSFNAAIGPGTCNRNGGLSFGQFFAALERGGAPSWRFSSDHLNVEAGGTITAVNRGGEFHTFTKVDSFAAGGCVPELNGPLGLPGRDPAFCGAAFSDPVLTVPAGAESEVPSSALERGHNHFQCMIHPWMTTTVTVRGDR